MADRTPVVVQARRTPQGKEDGAYAEVRGEDLSIPLIDEMLADTGLDGADSARNRATTSPA
jgi:acetyl-CoA acyltransferase